MGGYYGTEEQQRQQRKSDRLTEWIMETPGACLTGRLMGTDDPDRLGWDVIDQNLAEDGMFSFRWMDADGRKKVADYALRKGGNVFGWDGFLGNTETLKPVIDPILAAPLPAGMVAEPVTPDTAPEMQVRLAHQGMAPISAAVLCGQICRAQSLFIRDPVGEIAALGFIGMLQNRFSPIGNCAWVGVIAVDKAHRGKRLGKRVTAELIQAAMRDYGADSVMGFAAGDNLASKAMLQSCGMVASDRNSLVVSLSNQRYSR